jgi:AraC-like DNA-binding protein
MIIGVFEIADVNTILTSRHISPLYLIVVPSLYLYFKSLIKDYKHIYKKDLIHLIYPSLNFALNLAQEYVPVLRNQSVENVRFISLIAFILFYLTLSFSMLYNSLWKQKTNKSVEKKHYQLIKNWTLFLFVISSFLFLRILYSISSEKISNELFQAKTYSFLVIIPWFLIYGKILISPEILYGYPKLKKHIAEIQSQTTATDPIWIFDSTTISNPQDKKLGSNIKKNILPYISNIENFISKECPFRNSKFSLPDLAKALNIPASHLNYIFKYHAVISFVEYKNYCRIKDALELINQGCLDTLTLDGLASKIGFSSYNAFFTAFRKQTNLSPKDYLNHQGRPHIGSLEASLLMGE